MEELQAAVQLCLWFFSFLTGDVLQVVCTQSDANGSANSQPSFKTATKHLRPPGNNNNKNQKIPANLRRIAFYN